MTYKEYYLTLDSAKDIKSMVILDICLARFGNRDRIPIIKQSAKEAIKEKFGEESEVAERREDIENSPVDCSTPSVTDLKGERNELY